MDNQVHVSEREALLRSRAETDTHVRQLTQERGRLLALLEITQKLNSVLSKTEVLNRVMDSVLEISGVERGFLVLIDENGEFRQEISRNLDGTDDVVEDTIQISNSILKQAVETRQTVSVLDASSNPLFTSQKSVRDLRLKTIICLPLRVDQRVLGAIYLDSRRITPIVQKEGVQLLEAFAAQAAVAISNARSHEELKSTQASLSVENQSLKRAMASEFRFEAIVGKSQAMRRVFDVLERVAQTDVTVLVQGETGSGKELAARALHFSGRRKAAAFVPINCGSLPETLLESELFGVRRGAFTGATEDRAGLIEGASGGTLFLDEIGEMPPSLQVKLLRVLQDREVRRVGETHQRRVDIRLVAATNRDLRLEAAAGRFREDLLYRLQVVTITMPPLRDRPEDLLLLADHFLERIRVQFRRPGLHLTAEARSCILAHAWPGNVRELENALFRGAALSTSDGITGEYIVEGLTAPPTIDRGASLKEILQRSERSAIEAALRRTGGNISRAATTLAVSRQHLHNRIRKLGIPSAR